MAAKKKATRPLKTGKRRRAPRCVVCLENPRDGGHSKICDDCDIDFGVALHFGRGTIEWAANRARETMAKRLRKKE